MTAGIRAAAQREAERAFNDGADDMSGCCPDVQYGFERGAEWAVNRVTPTREQVARIFHGSWHDIALDPNYCAVCAISLQRADKVLALMAGLAEGDQ